MKTTQTPLKDLKLGELRRYKAWASDECREWILFLKRVEREIKMRKLTK